MKTKTLAGITVGLALVIAGCGDGGAPSSEPVTTVTEPESTQSVTTEPITTEPTTTEPITTEPTTTEPTTTEPEATEAPQAIISLSPTATEMLYAIGAGDQVLAVDDFSNFPAEAAEKMSGLSGFEPNVEAIAGMEPDLVVTDGTNPALLDQLDTLGVPHWEGPAATSFDDVYSQLEQLGAVTGHVGEAAELVGAMQQDIADVKAGLPQLDEPLTYYHELDATFFSVTSATFIGAVYAEIGLVNIADAVGDGNPYPQLNAEFIVDQNPDLIFLACTKYCGETAETVAGRDGWDQIDAVTGGGVIEMDDDVASRWGPRVVELLRAAGQGVAAVAASATVG
jgi:iron complex transport system substrate-binding protein